MNFIFCGNILAVSQTFSALLRRILKKQYRSNKAFAAALKIDASHLSRAMAPGGQPFNIEGCLHLARVTNTPPSTVLRAAGKGPVATLIEALYGPARELSASEQQLLRDYAAVKDEQLLHAVRTLLEVGAKQASRGGRKPGGRGGGGTTGGGEDKPESPVGPEIPKEPERVHRPAIYQRRARVG